MLTFTLPTDLVTDLEAEIAAVNKKARKLFPVSPPLAKLTCGAISHREVGQFFKELTEVTVKVVNRRPLVCDGWQIIAKVEHLDEGQNLIHRNLQHADFDLAPEWRTASPACQYCGHDRRRGKTYLLANETGQIQQVGSSCLADFLGYKDALEIAELFMNMNLGTGQETGQIDEEATFSNGKLLIPTDAYLSWAFMSARLDGYVSRSKIRSGEAEGIATADAALDYFVKGRRQLRKWDTPDVPSEQDDKNAENALAWIRGWSEKEKNRTDFTWGLSIIVEQEYIREGHLGYVAAIVGMWNRKTEKRRKAAKHPSQHIGEIGQRIELGPLKLLAVHHTEGFYGSTAIHKLQDEAGNLLTWFSSSTDLSEDFEWQEARYWGKATVKDHTEYKGVAQTVITRAQFNDRPPVKKIKPITYVVDVDGQSETLKLWVSKGQKILSVKDGHRWITLFFIEDGNLITSTISFANFIRPLADEAFDPKTETFPAWTVAKKSKAKLYTIPSEAPFPASLQGGEVKIWSRKGEDFISFKIQGKWTKVARVQPQYKRLDGLRTHTQLITHEVFQAIEVAYNYDTATLNW